MTEMTTNVSDLSRVRCCDREPCKLAHMTEEVAKSMCCGVLISGHMCKSWYSELVD